MTENHLLQSESPIKRDVGLVGTGAALAVLSHTAGFIAMDIAYTNRHTANELWHKVPAKIGDMAAVTSAVGGVAMLVGSYYLYKHTRQQEPVITPDSPQMHVSSMQRDHASISEQTAASPQRGS